LQLGALLALQPILHEIRFLRQVRREPALQEGAEEQIQGFIKMTQLAGILFLPSCFLFLANEEAGSAQGQRNERLLTTGAAGTWIWPSRSGVCSAGALTEAMPYSATIIIPANSVLVFVPGE